MVICQNFHDDLYLKCSKIIVKLLQIFVNIQTNG